MAERWNAVSLCLLLLLSCRWSPGAATPPESRVPVLPPTPGQPTLQHAACTSLAISWATYAEYTDADRISLFSIRYVAQSSDSGSTAWEEVLVNTSTSFPSLREVTNGSEGSAEQGAILSHSNESVLFTHVVEGLLSSTVYRVAVVAIGSSDERSNVSELLLAATTAAEFSAPNELSHESVTAHSTLLSWRVVPSCGVDVKGFEIHYTDGPASAQPASNTTATTQMSAASLPVVVFVPAPASATERPATVTVAHALTGLAPYTNHTLKVRSVGELRGDDSPGLLVVSEFTESVTFVTLEGAPTSPPLGVTAFLTHLHSSASFQWQAPPTQYRNGVISSYALSCDYMTNKGMRNSVHYSIPSPALHLELGDLQAGAHYSCHVAALTASGGRGPASAPVLFSTPIDLNARPHPPTNIGFEVLSPSPSLPQDVSSSPRPSIRARWDVAPRCFSTFNCSQVLGYTVACLSERDGTELRSTVWQSEIVEEVVAMTTIKAEPFTQYSCYVAALNSYGIGIRGSTTSVATPETVPSQAPTLLYTSHLDTTKVRVHWSYSETPPPGNLEGFIVKIYKADSVYPEKNGMQVAREIFEDIEEDVMDFWYDPLYLLSAGVEYNVVLAALTGAGAGPTARITFTTIRTVPQTPPTNLEAVILSYDEPFRYSFTWKHSNSPLTRREVHDGRNNIAIRTRSVLRMNDVIELGDAKTQPVAERRDSSRHDAGGRGGSRHSRQLNLHEAAPLVTGFVVHCSPNISSPSFISASLTSSSLTERLKGSYILFVDQTGVRGQDFLLDAEVPNGCVLGVSEFTCVVAGFNERGEGLRSEAVALQSLPCDPKGASDILHGSFLTDPYFSLAFLSCFVILFFLVLIALALLCICTRCFTDLLPWLKPKSFDPYSNADDENYIAMAPSDPRHKPRDRWTVQIREEGGEVDPDSPYNTYDEIPGERLENLYDEIHPRTALSMNSALVRTHGPRTRALSRHNLTRHTLAAAGSDRVPTSHTHQSLDLTHMDCVTNRDSTMTEYVEILPRCEATPTSIGAETVSGDYYPLSMVRTLTDIELHSDRQDDDASNNYTLNPLANKPLPLIPTNAYANVADCRCRGNYDRLSRAGRTDSEVVEASVTMETDTLSPVLSSTEDRPFSDCTDKDLPVIIITEGSNE